MSEKTGNKYVKSECKKFKEYYEKRFPELDEKQWKEMAHQFCKSINPQNLEYWQNKYPELSVDECEKLRYNFRINKRSNQPNQIEYYQKRYPELTLEEQEKLRKDYIKTINKHCIEYYQLHFPNLSNEEQQQKLKEYKEWNSSKQARQTGEKNGMHRSKRTQQQLNENCPWHKEFYKKRYPELSEEEQEKLRQDIINKTQNNIISTTSIEYYINKGMSEEEAKNALKERQTTFTLEKCIKKYGEIEGLKRFSERQQKWLKNLHKNFTENGDGRSLQSEIANKLFKKCCKILNISKPNKEKYIFDNIYNRAYSYDFVYNHKIIEFQGDYWHCNPTLYNEDFYNKVKQKTAKEIWQYDLDKKMCAKKYGYDVLYIWEYDYKENPERELNKCIEFLTNDTENN